jgi:DNA-binding response OmpR family regulator
VLRSAGHTADSSSFGTASRRGGIGLTLICAPSMLGDVKGCCLDRGICVWHIIVIDDDDDLRDLMQEALRAEGYEVSVAADGAQGIALQRKQPASLLITDIFMPNKEGIETIRDFHAEFPDVPIIAMSGGGRLRRRGSTLFAAKEVGAATILRKPFEMSDLLRSVAAMLNASQP